MSTKGRLTDIEHALEALAGAIRALEARVDKLEGAVAAQVAAKKANKANKAEKAVEDNHAVPAPALTAVLATDRGPAPGRDRTLTHVVTSIGQLVEAVQQLQGIIEPDDPVPLDAPVLGQAPVAAPAVPRDRRKLPQVRRADEEAEKAAAAELADHEAWLENLRQRLTSGQQSDEKGR
jgi:hypothetical protein